jgi:hypothetical protein
MFVKKLLELSQRSRLVPADFAKAVGSRLGAAHKETSVRTEYDLAASELIAGGTITTAQSWAMASMRPMASLQLTLQDIEPHFLDSAYMMDMITARSHDGPAIESLDHLFQVKLGMLVVRVPPLRSNLRIHADAIERAYGDRWDTVAGKRTHPDPVFEVLLTTEPRMGLEQQSTLRAFRDQARAAR